MKCLFYIPVALISLTSCAPISETYRAMDCNKAAVQRSTCAIHRNVEALNQVTLHLQQMQDEE